MKRKFALLTVLGALAALAIPASSPAAMFPAGHKFEIAGDANGPKLTTSLGSCLISKLTAQIPAAPGNTSGVWSGATITAGACTSGTTITMPSEWKFFTNSNSSVNSFYTSFLLPTGAIELRFSSLPGCKLVSSGELVGIWSNGVSTPSLLKSGYHADKASNPTWANDGGSCALAGKTEALSYEDVGPINGNYQSVTDLTSPSTPVTVANSK
jgi:hypothetical protein